MSNNFNMLHNFVAKTKQKLMNDKYQEHSNFVSKIESWSPLFINFQQIIIYFFKGHFSVKNNQKSKLKNSFSKKIMI